MKRFNKQYLFIIKKKIKFYIDNMNEFVLIYLLSVDDKRGSGGTGRRARLRI